MENNDAFWSALFGASRQRELGPETGQGFRDYLDFNVEAEALGFHSSFLVEHHFTGWNQVSATLMLLTCLAMRTTTLRLGTAVMVLPWHNPVLLAEQAATLDLISDGRLDFGVGKGYRHSEFKGFGIPPEEAEARFEEAIEVILRSWTSRTRFSHHGRFWQFEDIVVEPPTAQRPHPPFWVAAASAAVDPPRRRARLQSHSRSVCRARGDRRTHRALPRRTRSERHGSSIRCRWRWRASSTWRKTRPTRSRAGAARRIHPAHCRRVARARRQGGLACPRLRGQCRRRPRRNALVRNAGRNLPQARSPEQGRRRICAADDRWAARSSCDASRARSCRRFPVPGHPLW